MVLLGCSVFAQRDRNGRFLHVIVKSHGRGCIDRRCRGRFELMDHFRERVWIGRSKSKERVEANIRNPVVARKANIGGFELLSKSLVCKRQRLQEFLPVRRYGKVG